MTISLVCLAAAAAWPPRTVQGRGLWPFRLGGGLGRSGQKHGSEKSDQFRNVALEIEQRISPALAVREPPGPDPQTGCSKSST